MNLSGNVNVVNQSYMMLEQTSDHGLEDSLNSPNSKEHSSDLEFLNSPNVKKHSSLLKLFASSNPAESKPIGINIILPILSLEFLKEAFSLINYRVRTVEETCTCSIHHQNQDINTSISPPIVIDLDRINNNHGIYENNGNTEDNGNLRNESIRRRSIVKLQYNK